MISSENLSFLLGVDAFCGETIIPKGTRGSQLSFKFTIRYKEWGGINMMNQIRLTVGGVKYTVKSDENAEYLNALGNELEDRLRRITKRNPTLSTTMVAIIAALEASDEAKKAKDELFAIKKKYENNKQANGVQMRIQDK